MRDLLKKMGGRKFTSAVALAFLIAATDSLGLGLDGSPGGTLDQMSLILGAWIIGESAIDAASAVLVRPSVEPPPAPEVATPKPAAKQAAKNSAAKK